MARQVSRRRRPLGVKPRFNRHTRGAIYKALEARLPITKAVREAGVNISTYYKWMERGEGGDPIYEGFRRRVNTIITGAEAEALKVVREAAAGGQYARELKIIIGGKRGREVTRVRKEVRPQWQAAAWFLERRHREDYGRVGVDGAGERDAMVVAQEIRGAVDNLYASVPLSGGEDDDQ